MINPTTTPRPDVGKSGHRLLTSRADMRHADGGTTQGPVSWNSWRSGSEKRRRLDVMVRRKPLYRSLSLSAESSHKPRDTGRLILNVSMRARSWGYAEGNSRNYAS